MHNQMQSSQQTVDFDAMQIQAQEIEFDLQTEQQQEVFMCPEIPTGPLDDQDLQNFIDYFDSVLEDNTSLVCSEEQAEPEEVEVEQEPPPAQRGAASESRCRPGSACF